MEASSETKVVDFDTGHIEEQPLEDTHSAEIPAPGSGVNADTTSSSVHNQTPEPDRSSSEHLSAEQINPATPSDFSRVSATTPNLGNSAQGMMGDMSNMTGEYQQWMIQHYQQQDCNGQDRHVIQLE